MNIENMSYVACVWLNNTFTVPDQARQKLQLDYRLLFWLILIKRQCLQVFEKGILQERDDFRRVEDGKPAENGQSDLLHLRDGIIHA